MNIGIYGYGNLGRAVEIVSRDMKDVNVRAVFTSREVSAIRTLGAPAYNKSYAPKIKDEIDCMILCGASIDNFTSEASEVSLNFNTVDSYDVHSLIKEHVEGLSSTAKSLGHTSVVSAGWDPGLLSLYRIYSKSIHPSAQVNTFWGRGVSQGHSAAIRRIKGVKRAVQYTVPQTDALILANSGKTLPEKKRHKRECYVVAQAGYESDIENEITNMPEYFSGYETSVHFIDEDEFIRNHTSMKHRGECISFNMSGIYNEHISRATLCLELDSNPEFTASVMIAYARACIRLNEEGQYGAFTVYDIPPSYLMRSKDRFAYM